MEIFNHIQIRFHQINVCANGLVSGLGWNKKKLLLYFDTCECSLGCFSFHISFDRCINLC